MNNLTESQVNREIGKLSIIIPCYNSADTLDELLESLESQECSYPLEIIIADNGSTDNTIETALRFSDKFKNFKIIAAVEKKGCGYARNKGVECSSGDYLLFCDSDDVVGRNWLATMVAAFMEYDFIACRWEIEELNDESVVRSRGKGQTEGLMDFAIVEYLPFASGGTIGIKRSIHEKVGGFDEGDILEDIDYCWRVQLAGTGLHFVSDAVMHMRYRSTMWKTLKQSVSWATYNVKLYKKYKNKGMPDYSCKQSLVTLYRFFKKLPQLFSEKYKQRYIWKTGMILGSILGSFKYRIFVIH